MNQGFQLRTFPVNSTQMNENNFNETFHYSKIMLQQKYMTLQNSLHGMFT